MIAPAHSSNCSGRRSRAGRSRPRSQRRCASSRRTPPGTTSISSTPRPTRSSVRSRAFRSTTARPAAPDGSRFYFSSEAEQTLHVVDGKTLQITKKIPLTGRPNNISISQGRRARLRRHRLGARRGRRHRHDDARAGEEHSDEGRHSQRLRHARRQARRRRLDRRPTDDGRSIRRPRSRCGRCSRKACARWPSRRIRTDRPSASSCSSPNVHGFAIVDFAQRKEVGRIDAAERHSGGEGGQGTVQRVAVARPRRGAGWQDAVGDEPAERARLYVFAAGPEAAAEPGRSRRPARLGDVHARQQADLHRDGEHRSRSSPSTSRRAKKSRRSRSASRRSATSRWCMPARAHSALATRARDGDAGEQSAVTAGRRLATARRDRTMTCQTVRVKKILVTVVHDLSRAHRGDEVSRLLRPQAVARHRRDDDGVRRAGGRASGRRARGLPGAASAGSTR